MIHKHLGHLFGGSDPGDSMSHLTLVTAHRSDHTPLGFPVPDKLKSSWWALAPSGDVDANTFIARAIAMAVIDADQRDERVYLAALAVEAHTVVDDGDEVTENLARRLHPERKLHEHPRAVEATLLYAACRDGRRWTGTHLLTGPKAGAVLGPVEHVGPLVAEESMWFARLIRKAAGL